MSRCRQVSSFSPCFRQKRSPLRATTLPSSPRSSTSCAKSPRCALRATVTKAPPSISSWKLQQSSAHNQQQLAAALRGVKLLQGANGAPDPKLLSMTKLHMLGEVLGALFEKLHVRDAKAAEREEAIWGMLDESRDAADEANDDEADDANDDANGDAADAADEANDEEADDANGDANDVGHEAFPVAGRNRMDSGAL